MLTIYAVSDSIGETAELVAQAAARQFSEHINVKRVSYVKSMDDVSEFINSIDASDNDSSEKSMVVSTIVLADVREFLTQKCVEKNISITNVLGPIMNVAARLLNTVPEYNPGAVWNIDEAYNRRIEAIEFAIQYDDSKDYRGIKNADVILVGLSRTSKTPLSMYLANKGIKALNIPVIPEIPIPDELFAMDKRKIFGLTVDPLHLIEIRKHRLGNMHSSAVEYANDQRILDEYDYYEKLIKKLSCKQINVTKRAIEDTALIIMQSLKESFRED
ncbi:hypothetical protein SAMN02745248_00983 [Hathewaya proteolytica DSM 3090]|uniref:Putative pyruvate, phosphate dikinase regulatory protein n=1 Tax=Hathewaya proteolytica DSM 3090 TaxID=1121331 RepID=A0A1M6MB71_9CLOT|nr:pyruvate, water dikinase regulatory protein [Hathewaya proteolytica]SHJ80732.1 hypothetical protein SAMN02745248_00983 [Hathewaya proteolytica DSM 3090]